MRKKWILLAEDDPNDAELAITSLQACSRPCAIILARDGAEALELLSRERDLCGDPVFVLLDLKMPKVDGIEVLQRIKSTPEMKRIPVLILTSSRQEADVRRCYDLGANGYIVKPVRFKEFRESLLRAGAFWIQTNEPPP